MSAPRRSSQRRPLEDLDRLAEIFQPPQPPRSQSQRAQLPRSSPSPNSPAVTARALYSLFEDLDEDDCAFLINDLGLTGLAAELLPVLERVTAAAQRFNPDGSVSAAPAPRTDFAFLAASAAADSDDEDSDTALARELVMGCVRRAAERIAPSAPPAAAPSGPPAAPPPAPASTSAPAAAANVDDDLASGMQGLGVYDISDIESESSLSSTEAPPSSGPPSPAPRSGPTVSRSAPPTPQRRGPVQGYRVEADDFDATCRHLARSRGSRSRQRWVLRKEVGDFTEYGKVLRSVKHYSGAITKGYPSLAAAQAAFDYATLRGLVWPLASIGFILATQYNYELSTLLNGVLMSTATIEGTISMGISPTKQGEGKRKGTDSDASVSGPSTPSIPPSYPSRTRAKVRAAPPAIQLGYAVRAAQHRRDYLERRRRGVATATPALLRNSFKQLKTSVQRKTGQDNFVDANLSLQTLCHDTPIHHRVLADNHQITNEETGQKHTRCVEEGEVGCGRLELCMIAGGEW
ncbi:hypothetical protein R3P38DRAFT_3246518 [Favolaschia claudopus]|uniref:Uncharacterized protein n=1 Tax=Favolaschia claudopus TaxID=2862362 RepID=A0AAV9YYM2_9AGAR